MDDEFNHKQHPLLSWHERPPHVCGGEVAGARLPWPTSCLNFWIYIKLWTMKRSLLHWQVIIYGTKNGSLQMYRWYTPLCLQAFVGPHGKRARNKVLEFGLGPLNILVIPNKCQMPIWAWGSGGVVQTFNPILLEKIEEILWISYIST